MLNNGSGFRRLFPTYDDDRDAAYRRYAADKPSLQRQTVAQEARAQECLEQRARVLEKEKARWANMHGACAGCIAYTGATRAQRVMQMCSIHAQPNLSNGSRL